MLEETKSNWQNVAESMKESLPLLWELENSRRFHENPTHILEFLAYYKFAAKMIGNERNVLDLTIEDGLSTYLLAKECRFVQGIGNHTAAIDSARKNFSLQNLSFSLAPTQMFHAIVAITPWKQAAYPLSIDSYKKHLLPHGMVIFGSPLALYTSVEHKLKRFCSIFFLFEGRAGRVEPVYEFTKDSQYCIVIGCV